MSIADGCWHHIVLTRIYSSPLISSFSLYVDGEIRGTVNPTDVEDVALGATNLNVGHPWGSSPLFTFDEVLIWNRALSAQEVKSLSMVTGEITGSYGNKLVHGTLAVHGNLTLFQPNVEISVSLPTSCPGSGKLWNDNGTVKIGI